jgi:chromosome partitioning protein
MPVIAAVNLKGGVGKTSTCLHLAGALSQLGRRVLLVDNDPQSSLTAGFLGPQPARQLDPSATVAAVHAGDEPFPEAVIRPSGFDRIDLLPGSRFAASFNIPDPHRSPYEDQVRLRDFLAQVRHDYDLVMIDCPPNLHAASWAAMAASDYLLVPVMPEDFGAQGTQDVAESAAMVRAVVNPGLDMLGYLVSMYQARRTVHQMYVERLRAGQGAAVFAAMIPAAVDYVEAITALKPVAFHKPKGAAAKAVKAVADEMLARVATQAAGRERGAA